MKYLIHKVKVGDFFPRINQLDAHLFGTPEYKNLMIMVLSLHYLKRDQIESKEVLYDNGNL